MKSGAAGSGCASAPPPCPARLVRREGPRALGASARRIAAYAALCQAEARGRDRWALCAQHAGGLLRVMAWLGLANHAHACARRGIPDPQSKQNTKPTPPKSQRSARSDGRFRGDSQSPGIGPRDARHHDGTHARPVRPSFICEGMAPEVAASRAPSASTVSIHAALDEQADLGAASAGLRAAELSAALRCTGCFFLCARAGGVWRVACFGPLNPLGPKKGRNWEALGSSCCKLWTAK